MITWFNRVEGQISSLIDIFNLSSQEQIILNAYHLIGREALNVPLNHRFPKFSTLNNDGTPIQFSVSLGGMKGGLRFLGEIGNLDTNIIQRKKFTCNRLKEILQLLNLSENEDTIFPILDEILPNRNKEFRNNTGGAMWIGFRFHQNSDPLLKIYANLKWGNIEESKNNFFKTIEQYGFSKSWVKKIVNYLSNINTNWNPLGVAFTLGKKGILETALYMRSYTKTFTKYEKLINELGFEIPYKLVNRFKDELIGNTIGFPSGSLVLSYGMSKELISMKIEACCHCIFPNDWNGKRTCSRLLNEAGFESATYESLLDVLSEGNLSKSETNYHCFIGFGVDNSSRNRINIYLKPYFKKASVNERS